MSATYDAESAVTAAARLPIALPGRLGDPAAEYRSDPRANRRLRETLATLGLDAPAAPPPLTRAAPLATQLEFILGAHDAFEAVYAAIPDDQPGRDDITRTEHAARARRPRHPALCLPTRRRR